MLKQATAADMFNPIGKLFVMIKITVVKDKTLKSQPNKQSNRQFRNNIFTSNR